LAENKTLKKTNHLSIDDKTNLELEITAHLEEIKNLKDTITTHRITEQKLGFEKDKLEDDTVKLIHYQ
jgi:hypothetical protein